nr:hypothetical protein [uncultured Dongia sp.]
MARNAVSRDHESGHDTGALVQATFDFLPQEIRHRMRFGDVLKAGQADMRHHSRMIDRQVVGLGSRIAAARLREILRPDSERGRNPLGIDAVEETLGETQILEQGLSSVRPSATARPGAEALQQQRDILREIGTAVFYFRDEEETPSDIRVEMQRLHPRPLPARYYGAPPQQAGAHPTPDDALSWQSTRKRA